MIPHRLVHLHPHKPPEQQVVLQLLDQHSFASYQIEDLQKKGPKRRSSAIDGRPTSEYNFANRGDISFRISSTTLVDFHDARRFDYGRFLLALREAFGALAINVYTAELFAIMVIHGDLPMAMFASAIAVKPAGALALCLGSLFLHDEVALNAPGL